MQKSSQEQPPISHNFCCTIAGVPGSGKTSFIESLWHQHIKQYFQYVLIISPSPISISDRDMDNQIDDLRLDWIYDKLNLLKQDNVTNANILIIMDDCVSSIKSQQGDRRLQDLFFNRRHLVPKCPISIIMTTQQFTMIPLKFRGVTDHISFLSMNPKDLEYLKKEIVFSQYRKYLPQLMDVYQQPHGFVFVRMNPFTLCQNYKPLIAGTKYVGVAASFNAIVSGNERRSTKLEERSARQTPSPPPSKKINNLFSFKTL